MLIFFSRLSTTEYKDTLIIVALISSHFPFPILRPSGISLLLPAPQTSWAHNDYYEQPTKSDRIAQVSASADAWRIRRCTSDNR